MSSYKPVVLALVVIGAISWGLIGLLNINIVSLIFGTGTVLERVVYVLVGLSGLVVAWDKWVKTKK